MTNRGDLLVTKTPLRSWEFLRFWDYYFEAHMYHKLLSKTVCPPEKDWFKALEMTTFPSVKVVILGQDPYHTKGMAHGLAFSVQPHVKRLPPSLRNILQEYQDDLGYPKPSSGDLRAWAERGVLLLNTILTVEEGKPLSHKGLGWEKLAYEVIRSTSETGKVVFVLLGKQAQEYTAACGGCPVVAAAHPSPLAEGFSGSKIFTRVNAELKKLGVSEVDWRLQ